MLDNNCVDKATYSDLMDEIKRLNQEYKEMRSSRIYKIGKAIEMTAVAIRSRNIEPAKRQFVRWINAVQSKKFLGTPKKICDKFESNYFSNKRIAVYTVVFGKYDTIQEPYCHPNNIDYYIITDQDFDLKNSCWKKKDIVDFEKNIRNMSNVEKNRYFKMNPFDVFSEYEYTIYIDGNIQVISDLTEYIYRIGKCGFAAHMHSTRDCVYEESKAVVFAKKETQEHLDIHLEHLRSDKFPEHYGMLECNVLVRRNCDDSRQLMCDWWREFMMYSKRDQMSIPYVLYKNGVSIEEVGTLGNNVYENPSFRVVVHN